MKTAAFTLQVKYHGQQVGRLAVGTDNLCRFEYALDWLATGFSISPFFLPLRQELFVAKYQPFNGLFGVFADSMPDGWGNLLLDRFLKHQGAALEKLTVIDRLALVGTGGMGALQYEPDKSFRATHSNYKLDTIAVQVQQILSEQAELPDIMALLEQTGSSGGARPKVIIQYRGESWLVKFGSTTDPNDVGAQEYFYSNLAKKCGIRMPETHLFEGKYFGTRLFDRTQSERYHVHSASGILHASHRYPSLDYKDLAQLTNTLTHSVQDTEQLLRQMVFNVLIENMDDHAKNFSFLYRDNKWELSPAYDILRSAGFNGEHATAVAGAGKPTRKDMLAVAAHIGFPTKKMKRIIEEILDLCLDSEIGSALGRRKL